MKFYKYKLSEWIGFGEDGYKWNHYRVSETNTKKSITVGLILMDDTYTFRLNPNRCSWALTSWGGEETVSLCRSLTQFMNHCSNNRKYLFHEIEQGKQDVDNYIIKFNRLKCFI